MKKALFFVFSMCNITHTEQKRDYQNSSRNMVQETYRLNHTHQTVDFVRSKHTHYLSEL